MGQRIRVVVANRPRLFREIVLTAISDQSDIEIVGVAENEEEILRIVEQMQPDFLIVALEDSDERPVICDFVFERRPQVKALAIAPERNTALLYWTTCNIQSRVVESSEEGILQALRSGGFPAGSE